MSPPGRSRTESRVVLFIFGVVILTVTAIRWGATSPRLVILVLAMAAYMTAARFYSLATPALDKSIAYALATSILAYGTAALISIVWGALMEPDYWTKAREVRERQYEWRSRYVSYYRRVSDSRKQTLCSRCRLYYSIDDHQCPRCSALDDANVAVAVAEFQKDTLKVAGVIKLILFIWLFFWFMAIVIFF